jgi:poly(hydroxyalkanoate) granule-associated protein
LENIMAKRTTRAEAVKGEIQQSASRVWLAGLGALATVGQEGEKLFETLVERGERLEIRGRKVAHKGAVEMHARVAEAKQAARGAWRQLEALLDDKVADALNRVGVPTRDEIRNLAKRVSELTSKVETKKAAPRRPASGKRATRPKAGKR